MKDQRSHKRFSGECINCTITSAADVEIMNISVGGVAVKADSRLNIGKEYTLRIEENGKIFTVKGTIVWAVLSGSTRNKRNEMVPIYKAGMRFEEAKSEGMTSLIRFIEQHKKFPEQRIVLRFAIASPEKAVLSHCQKHRVKKVSLGGLLLESEQAFIKDDIRSMELSLGEDRVISFAGRVASCLKAEGDSGHFVIGIEFLEMSEKDRNLLQDFVNSL